VSKYSVRGVLCTMDEGNMTVRISFVTYTRSQVLFDTIIVNAAIDAFLYYLTANSWLFPMLGEVLRALVQYSSQSVGRRE